MAEATTAKTSWIDELADAVSEGRLDLQDEVLEQGIRDAFAADEVYIRQIEVDMSRGFLGTERVDVRPAYPARLKP